MCCSSWNLNIEWMSEMNEWILNEYGEMQHIELPSLSWSEHCLVVAVRYRGLQIKRAWADNLSFNFNFNFRQPLTHFTNTTPWDTGDITHTGHQASTSSPCVPIGTAQSSTHTIKRKTMQLNRTSESFQTEHDLVVFMKTWELCETLLFWVGLAVV